MTFGSKWKACCDRGRFRKDPLSIPPTNAWLWKQKIIRFRTDLKAETASRKEAETALLEAQSNYIELSERLKQTQDELDVVVEERQTAVTAANTLKVRLVQSAAESANVTRERDEASR